MLYKTYNTKLIFENSQDKEKIIKFLEQYKFTFNEASRIQFYIKKSDFLQLHHRFYYKFRRTYPYIKSSVVSNAEKECHDLYRLFRKNNNGFSKPIYRTKLFGRLNSGNFTYKNNILRIVSSDKRIPCRFSIYKKLQDLLSQYSFKNLTIYYKKNNIFVGIMFEIPEVPISKTLATGIDLGCSINAATSENKLYFDKKFNKEKRKLRYLKRRLQSKIDSGSKSAKRHFKKLKHSEHNKNHNFNHHLANRLIQDTKADVLVLENLINIKHNQFKNNNKISQIPFYALRSILTYKAPIYGKTVILVNPAYTSKTDSVTGKTDGKRAGRRYYSKSGKIYDSDINAAINIALLSKLPISLGTRNSIGTYGQASVTLPIVGPKGYSQIQ